MNERLREWNENLGLLVRRHGMWWWRRRARIADWFYALFTLPFSGLMMLAGTTSGIGLFSKPFAALMVAPIGAPEPGPAAAWTAVATLFALFVIPGTLASATMLWRRTSPRWLLIAGAILMIGYGDPIPLMVGLYSYPAFFSDRKVLTGWFALGVLSTALVYNASVTGFVMAVIVFLLVPVFAGLWIGTRRELIERLEERAERLEREQHMMAEQAISSERTRIAREMHDVVAHRVSLMVLHAGGLEVSATDDRTVEAAGLIRTTGREALAELRGILGVLRDEGGETAPTAPQPVLDDLERLLGEWRGAGMEVRREESGDPRPLPVQVQRTAYRVVQEALTNAAKHATGAVVDVHLYYAADRLELEVSNGPAPGVVNPPPRSGYGLTGLSERVALAGGEVSAGPCPDGGWRLRAILPLGETDENDAPVPNTEVEEEGSEGDPHTPGR
ncbi:sensor histidine kinase [Nocardiopsis alba]|uniref:sensor histidine kinase n=1 Tax=Nocardiopsis alba TaxID=53437 RepID=UPI003405158E